MELYTGLSINKVKNKIYFSKSCLPGATGHYCYSWKAHYLPNIWDCFFCQLYQSKRESYNYISHFFFADDLVAFCCVDQGSVKELELLLKELELNTGLSITKVKSKIYFSKSCLLGATGHCCYSWKAHCLPNIWDCFYLSVISK